MNRFELVSCFFCTNWYDQIIFIPNIILILKCWINPAGLQYTFICDSGDNGVEYLPFYKEQRHFKSLESQESRKYRILPILSRDILDTFS